MRCDFDCASGIVEDVWVSMGGATCCWKVSAVETGMCGCTDVLLEPYLSPFSSVQTPRMHFQLYEDEATNE